MTAAGIMCELKCCTYLAVYIALRQNHRKKLFAVYFHHNVQLC